EADELELVPADRVLDAGGGAGLRRAPQPVSFDEAAAGGSALARRHAPTLTLPRKRGRGRGGACPANPRPDPCPRPPAAPRARPPPPPPPTGGGVRGGGVPCQSSAGPMPSTAGGPIVFAAASASKVIGAGPPCSTASIAERSSRR